MINYLLMHKNKRLLAFSLDDDLSVIGHTINEAEQKHLPLSYGANIHRWLHDRTIPATRQGLSNHIPTVDTFALMLDNLGLSLTDGYWLNPVGSGYTWESVNLYSNAFRDPIPLDLESTFVSIANKTNFIPSASLRGDLQKKWLIDKDGIRIIVKGNYSDTCVQSISEVLASDIYSRQSYQIEFAPYSFLEIESNGKKIVGCKCPNFTTEDLEFIPAIDIVNSMKCPNDKNYFQFYLELLEQHDIDCREFYDMMLMVDFVISNTDRHFNNFGILRDSNTLQWVKPAPVFDSGNSMFYNLAHVPTGANLLDIAVTSFYKKEVKLLSQVKNRGLLKIAELPTVEYVFALLGTDDTLDQNRKEALVEAYKTKIAFLDDFQNGADIWSYDYLRELKQSAKTISAF